MNRIAIIVEHMDGKMKPSTFELFTAAKALQTPQKTECMVVVLGENVEQIALEASAQSGFETIAINVPGLVSYNSETYLKVLGKLFKEFPFQFCLCTHSTQSLDFAPALAVQTNSSCITAVEQFGEASGKPTFKRSVLGGKLITEIISQKPSAVITIQPGSFKFVPSKDNSVPVVKVREEFNQNPKIQNLGVLPSESDSSALTDAKVIIAAGRGVGDEENIALIAQLAALFGRSAVAGSRPLCDLSWLEYKQQVGITGATVSPDLYLACGISGTSQHVTAMKGSGMIIAINSDPHAAFFNTSDICIIEDLVSFIPVFIEEYQKQKKEG